MATQTQQRSCSGSGGAGDCFCVDYPPKCMELASILRRDIVGIDFKVETIAGLTIKISVAEKRRVTA